MNIVDKLKQQSKVLQKHYNDICKAIQQCINTIEANYNNPEYNQIVTKQLEKIEKLNEQLDSTFKEYENLQKELNSLLNLKN